MRADYTETIRFLQHLSPPFLLTAIPEGGAPKTQRFEDTQGIEAWCSANADCNLFYHIGTPREGVTGRMSKSDVAALEWLWVDIDPPRYEDREEILEKLRRYTPAPSIVVDSGNGFQGLWRLSEPFSLWFDEDIGEFEGRLKGLTTALGGDPQAAEVARILRLPGTINHPNARKRSHGKIPRKSSFEVWSDEVFDIPIFPSSGSSSSETETPMADLRITRSYKKGEVEFLGEKWESLAEDCEDSWYYQDAGYPSRSEVVMGMTRYMLEKGMSQQQVYDVLLSRDLAISGHLYDQSDPERSARRAIRNCLKSMKDEKPEESLTADTPWDMTAEKRDKEGHITKPAQICVTSLKNQRLAFAKVGVACTHNELSGVNLLNGEPFESHIVTQVRYKVEEKYHATFGQKHMEEAALALCHLNQFDPRRDYLNGLPKHDGTSRLDNWLFEYCGAVIENKGDEALIRAYGRATLIAAVMRVYEPGCKFDEMLILEGEQGSGKSSLLRALVPESDWFSDQLSLKSSGKEFMEQAAGHWIMECPELEGIRGAGVNKLKTLLSTRVDKARLAYARSRKDRPRDYILIGTTNRSDYLQDETGNRRFWPIRCSGSLWDRIPKLVAERDQLWAEAKEAYESGEKVWLDPALARLSGLRTQARMEEDPLQGKIAEAVGRENGILNMHTLLDFLGILPPYNNAAREAGKALRALGFQSTQVRMDGERQRVWQRGEGGWIEFKHSKDEVM